MATNLLCQAIDNTSILFCALRQWCDILKNILCFTFVLGFYFIFLIALGYGNVCTVIFRELL